MSEFLEEYLRSNSDKTKTALAMTLDSDDTNARTVLLRYGTRGQAPEKTGCETILEREEARRQAKAGDQSRKR